MTGPWVLVPASVRREVRVSRSYLVPTLLQVVVLTVGLALALSALRRYGDDSIVGAGAVEATAASLLMLMVAPMAANSSSASISAEAKTGTLEQQAMSRFGLLPVTVAGTIPDLLIGAAFSMAVLVGAKSIGLEFRGDFLSVVVVLALTTAGALGIGLVLGGLTLVLKRIDSLAALARLALAAAIALPAGEFTLLRLVPLSWGSVLLRRVLVEGEPVLSNAAAMGFLIAHSGVLLVIGVAAFWRFERIARDRGLLGQY
jgi:ABC-2 type transport system permease protein